MISQIIFSAASYFIPLYLDKERSSYMDPRISKTPQGIRCLSWLNICPSSSYTGEKGEYWIPTRECWWLMSSCSWWGWTDDDDGCCGIWHGRTKNMKIVHTCPTNISLLQIPIKRFIILRISRHPPAQVGMQVLGLRKCTKFTCHSTGSGICSY